MRWPFIALALALLPGVSAALPLAGTGVIVVDTAHEPQEGVARPGAAAERDYAQKVAQHLKGIVERENGKGVVVMFLNAGDKDAPQRERAAAANQAGGKLYLALHSAGLADAQRHGLGVYTPDAGDAPAKSWRALPRRHFTRNRALGDKLRSALQQAYPALKVFAGETNLYLFHGLAMPSAAVELALPEGMGPGAEESGKRMAEALYNAIAEYEKAQ